MMYLRFGGDLWAPPAPHRLSFNKSAAHRPRGVSFDKIAAHCLRCAKRQRRNCESGVGGCTSGKDAAANEEEIRVLMAASKRVHHRVGGTHPHTARTHNVPSRVPYQFAVFPEFRLLLGYFCAHLLEQLCGNLMTC